MYCSFQNRCFDTSRFELLHWVSWEEMRLISLLGQTNGVASHVWMSCCFCAVERTTRWTARICEMASECCNLRCNSFVLIAMSIEVCCDDYAKFLIPLIWEHLWCLLNRVILSTLFVWNSVLMSHLFFPLFFIMTEAPCFVGIVFTEKLVVIDRRGCCGW